MSKSVEQNMKDYLIDQHVSNTATALRALMQILARAFPSVSPEIQELYEEWVAEHNNIVDDYNESLKALAD